MSRPRLVRTGLATTLLGAAMTLGASAQGAGAANSQNSVLAQANAALQSGEADKAVGLLTPVPASGQAEARNVLCRVHLMLQQWDAAASDCEEAVRQDGQNSNDHLWLGRALGEKAARASFLTAFSLAKRTRAEFEQAVQLDGRNVEALSDLGDFYRQAPGVVGGGIDKAQGVAGQLDKVDAGRAHRLRGNIAEQQKDYGTAEREYKLATTAGAHPAAEWRNLAAFYGRRKRYDEMDSAIKSALSAARRDKHAGVALYDCAGLLIENHRDPALAASLLGEYLAGSEKSEEAPAFMAHLRLAQLKQQAGDAAGAEKERAAALALAHEYKPAQESAQQQPTNQPARF